MHRAGVVPHQRITRLPGVRVHKLRLGSPVKEKAQHLGALVCIPADNLGGHAGAQIQRFSSGDRVRAHNRMMDIWRTCFLLVVGRHTVSLVEGLVRLIGQTAVQFLARRLRQRLPGRTHICEFRIAALRGKRIGHQQRAHGRLGEIDLIVVPADLAI